MRVYERQEPIERAERAELARPADPCLLPRPYRLRPSGHAGAEFQFNVGGRVEEISIICATRREWDRLPQSRSGDWSAQDCGDVVIAVRHFS